MDFSLLLILQRYEFSSKSQRSLVRISVRSSCCWYYKGTNFQANHNNNSILARAYIVVADTTKVRIFKQITTTITLVKMVLTLLLILQRYEFSSKSQPHLACWFIWGCCCWYYKGTNFQANHNVSCKIRDRQLLLLILQRYEFSSKSQHTFCK